MDYTDYQSGLDSTAPELSAANDALASGMSAGMVILLLAVGLLSLVGLWKIFTKAGKPGWAALIPFYNLYVLLQIVGRPTWWILLFLAAFIPFVGWIPSLIASVIVTHDLSKSFGKDIGWTLFLLLLSPIAYIVLGFGDSKYQGPSVKPAAAGAAAGPSRAPASNVQASGGAPASPAAAPQSPAADDANGPASPAGPKPPLVQ